MKIDPKLAKLLSNFFLDIAKAYFITTFVTPSFPVALNAFELAVLLTKGIMNVILFLLLSWIMAKYK